MERVSAEAIAALERGATVVTGNRRAARTLRLEFDRHNRALARRSWQPAKALAWDAWLSGWWNRLTVQGKTQRMPLNRSQELAVWRSVLEADPECRSLRGVESLAAMAADAWGLLCRYNGTGRLRDLGASSDTRAFQRWAFAFDRRCRNEDLLTQSSLAEALRQGVGSGAFEPEAGEIVLLGFDTWTPAQTSLLEALRDAGAALGELPVGALAADRMLVEATDEERELQACAYWVRRTLLGQSHARIAIVVPGLDAERAEIDRVLREVLAPELEDIASGPPPFEFSVGVALSTTPMVHAALDLLRWLERPLPLDSIGQLLLSPYFANAREERSARAEFDAFHLREAHMLRPELSLDQLSYLVEKYRNTAKQSVVARHGLTDKVHGLPQLTAALRRMEQAAEHHLSRTRTQNAIQTRAEWTDTIRAWLTASAWGAGQDEDGIEFQIRATWESALDELATLDFDGSLVPFAHALADLERIAARTVFAAESREAPVQVMGPLEAAGGRFDAVWFLLAGELDWPMATTSSSLLPWGLQRELGMPGTDAARELAFARTTSLRIAQSTETVVFSYARLAGDEVGRQRVSAALDGLGLEPMAAQRTTQTILAGSTEPDVVTLETIEDDVQLPALPDRIIGGGASLLAAQAACGFRAFVERRLWSSEPAGTELGMDALQRGTLVHGVLERLWKHLKTQETLQEMTAAEREEVLAWCIAEEIRPVESSIATPWDAAYLDMERRRLQTLLGQWLDLELARPPFEVKRSEMQLNDVRVGPLRLKVVVDRVDLVDDGETETGEAAEMIFDYKTGQAEPGEWLGERPDAPQLPLYAVLSNAKRIAGVAFAKVRSGDDMDLHGYATGETLVTKFAKLKDAPTLAAQVEEWRRVLTKLAEDFAAGEARVNPKQYPKTCAHCAQRPVCRLDGTTLEAAVDEEGIDRDE